MCIVCVLRLTLSHPPLSLLYYTHIHLYTYTPIYTYIHLYYTPITYIDALNKHHMNMAMRTARSRSHSNQYSHMKRCWQQFRDIENVHGFKYDYFIRLRDDAFVFETFQTFVIGPPLGKCHMTYDI
jgi:hypothetical protein